MSTKNCNLFEQGLCVSPINPQPLENFFEAKGVKDGRGARCKACIKAIAHERRLKIGGGQLRVPKRPKAVPMDEKNCSKFRSGQCVSPINPQPISNFRSQEGRINGRSLCLSCEQKYYEDNKEETKKRAKEWNKNNKVRRKFFMYRKLYGLTKEKFIELHISQEGSCAICKTHESELSRPLVVDHCHIQNKVRGLLCDRCNLMLGFFDHDSSRIERAIEYIAKYQHLHLVKGA